MEKYNSVSRENLTLVLRFLSWIISDGKASWCLQRLTKHCRLLCLTSRQAEEKGPSWCSTPFLEGFLFTVERCQWNLLRQNLWTSLLPWLSWKGSSINLHLSLYISLWKHIVGFPSQANLQYHSITWHVKHFWFCNILILKNMLLSLPFPSLEILHLTSFLLHHLFFHWTTVKK